MSETKINNYFEQIKQKMDTYVHFVYGLSKTFPKSELYGALPNCEEQRYPLF